MVFVSNSNYKMMLYSAHDVTLAPILMLLGVLDDKWPDFAADIAFELYRDKVYTGYLSKLWKLSDYLQLITIFYSNKRPTSN